MTGNGDGVDGSIERAGSEDILERLFRDGRTNAVLSWLLVVVLVGVFVDTVITGSEDPTRSVSTDVFDTSAGETLEARVWKDSGGSKEFFGSSHHYTSFNIRKVG